jgi:hypothetical protein
MHFSRLHKQAVERLSFCSLLKYGLIKLKRPLRKSYRTRIVLQRIGKRYEYTQHRDQLLIIGISAARARHAAATMALHTPPVAVGGGGIAIGRPSRTESQRVYDLLTFSELAWTSSPHRLQGCRHHSSWRPLLFCCCCYPAASIFMGVRWKSAKSEFPVLSRRPGIPYTVPRSFCQAIERLSFSSSFTVFVFEQLV